MKNAPRSKNNIIVTLCLIFVISIVGFNLYQKERKKQLVVNENHLRFVVDDYFKSKSVGLLSLPAPHDFASIIAFQKSYSDKANGVVEKCKNVSPLASQIASHYYQRFICSLFENGMSKMVYIGTGVENVELTKNLQNAQELCFFSSEDKVKFRLPSSLYWNDKWKAVMVQMMDWPEAVFAGMLIHELGHGYYSTVLNRKSAHAPADSRFWAEEEITMHELEAEVFNKLSSGEYYRTCDRVLLKAKGSKVPEILAGLELNDLRELDRSLGAETASQEIANLLLAEHMIVICCRYMDKNGLGMDGKINAYRELTSTRF